METNKQKQSEVYEQVRRITEPIFKKVLQEASRNRISVGGSVSVAPEKCFYNPHNCRAYFDFSKSSKNPFNFNQTEPPKKCRHKIVNKTEHSFTNFFDCTIRVRKNTIEIANQMNPRWYVIDITTNAGEQINKIVMQKIKESKKILRQFIKIYGGRSQDQLMNLVLKDNKIQGEKAIDHIPRKLKFHNRVGKKEYNESLFEFNSPAHASNYLEARAVENIAPDIVKAIELINPLKAIKQTCRNVQDVIESKKLVELLTRKEKEDLTIWTFQKFST